MYSNVHRVNDHYSTTLHRGYSCLAATYHLLANALLWQYENVEQILIDITRVGLTYFEELLGLHTVPQ